MATPSVKAESAPAGPEQHHNGRQMNAIGCSGEGCVARQPWPIHHVRHRGNICRLCTSCVLRYHPGSFCASCFDLVDSAAGRGSTLSPLVHCAGCPSVCHAACLADSEKAVGYICPTCSNPSGYFYFTVDRDSHGDASDSPTKRIRVPNGITGKEKARTDGRECRAIDQDSAKVLLAAARLASASLSRAVALTRSEAERKVREAVVARKKAKEMLEKAIAAARREREKKPDVLCPAMAVPELQRKVSVKVGNAAASMVAQKGKSNAERERWLKVEEVTPLAQIAGKEKLKVPFPDASHDKAKLDLVGRNGSILVTKSTSAAESKRDSSKVPVASGLAVRSPRTKQDPSVAKTTRIHS